MFVSQTTPLGNTALPALRSSEAIELEAFDSEYSLTDSSSSFFLDVDFDGLKLKAHASFLFLPLHQTMPR